MKSFHEAMTCCPKCDSPLIRGPIYRTARRLTSDCPWDPKQSVIFLNEEHMVWTCGKCGYEETTRCMDHNE